MTVEEINDYLTEIYNKKYRIGKPKRSQNIYTINAKFILECIVEYPQKTEAIRILLENNLRGINSIKKLFIYGYITIDDIISVGRTNGEIYYITPEVFYEKHSQLYDEVIKAKQDIVFDYLPEIVRRNEKVTEAFKRTKKIYNKNGRDKEGYDHNWLDENGNLISFFTLVNNYVIKSKEDYLRIVRKYIEACVSVPEFCKQYGISSVEGFNKLLDRVKEEYSDIRQDVDKARNNAQKKYLEKIKSLAHQIDNGELTFKEYMDNEYNPNHKFKLLYSCISNKRLLMKQVIDYIQNEQIIKVVELCSLFGAKLFDLERAVNDYIIDSSLKRFRVDLKSLRKYNSSFMRKNSIYNLTINGITYKIDDSVVDQALAYIDSNHIYRCQYTVDVICKKIAIGEIIYKEETEEQKQAMKNIILEKLHKALEKANSIDDYFSVMEEHNKHR